MYSDALRKSIFSCLYENQINAFHVINGKEIMQVNNNEKSPHIKH